MADTKPTGNQLNIGSILIKGAPTSTSAARLDRAIQSAIGRALVGSDPTSGGQHPLDIPHLRLQLPPQATEAEIAEALAHAIDRTRRGDRP